jgi:hypothetical protein
MVENIEFQHEFEDVDPPPPGLISSYETPGMTYKPLKAGEEKKSMNCYKMNFFTG